MKIHEDNTSIGGVREEHIQNDCCEEVEDIWAEIYLDESGKRFLRNIPLDHPFIRKNKAKSKPKEHITSKVL